MWRTPVLPVSVAALAATAALMITASVAEATIMVPLTLEDLAQRSRTVVRAKVLQRQSVWDKAHKRIYTLTELAVSEVIVGEPPETITVRTLGGEVDGVGMAVSGTARMQREQDVILFLRDDPLDDDGFMVVGMSQGLYRIEKDSAGRTLAVPGVEGMAFARTTAEGVRKVDHRTEAIRLPYDELKARVRAARPTIDTTPTSPLPQQPVPTP